MEESFKGKDKKGLATAHLWFSVTIENSGSLSRQGVLVVIGSPSRTHDTA